MRIAFFGRPVYTLSTLHTVRDNGPSEKIPDPLPAYHYRKTPKSRKRLVERKPLFSFSLLATRPSSIKPFESFYSSRVVAALHEVTSSDIFISPTIVPLACKYILIPLQVVTEMRFHLSNIRNKCCETNLCIGLTLL